MKKCQKEDVMELTVGPYQCKVRLQNHRQIKFSTRVLLNELEKENLSLTKVDLTVLFPQATIGTKYNLYTREELRKNLNNDIKIDGLFTILISVAVIIFGVVIMGIPILKIVKIPSMNSLELIFLFVVLSFLFLPTIIYCFVAIKTKKIEYVIIPAICLLIAEYYFFHDFLSWIASDPNAAIGIVIAPFYLIFILGFSYGLAFIFSKILKWASSKNEH